MKQITCNIILAFCLLLSGQNALLAQSGIYVPKGGKVFFAGDTAAMYANFTNDGNVAIAKTAVVNFSGRVWENSPEAQITDELEKNAAAGGAGGTVRFSAQHFRQQLDGGYNAATKAGAKFFNLNIQNPNGVELINSSTKVSESVSLENGPVFLRDQIFVVGHSAPGNISGYNASRYFVTGNRAGTGLLVREGIGSAQGLVTFPIGTVEGYTPAALRNNGMQGDDFSVSVFDRVYTNVTTGQQINNQTVNKTWEVGKMLRPGTDEVELVLQHQTEDEGIYFKRNSNNSYISQHNGIRWDTATPHKPGNGYLSSGAPLVNGRTNRRLLKGTVGSSSFFTKLAVPLTSLKTKIIIYGYRLDAATVHLEWGTNPEVDVASFIVQRRLSTESSYSNVDTVASKTLFGLSVDHLHYQINDPNGYSGVTYYRLMVRSHNGDITFTEIIAVGGMPGEFNMMVWPNPTADVCNVSINTIMPAKSVMVWDMLGQVVHEEPVNNRRIVPINLRPYAQSTYIIGLVSPTNHLIGAKKVVRSAK